MKQNQSGSERGARYEGYRRRLGEVAASKAGTTLVIGFSPEVAAIVFGVPDAGKCVIVVSHAQTYARVLALTKQAWRKVVPYLGSWQEVVSTLSNESFSSIVFCQREGIKEPASFFEEAYRLLRKGGVLTYDAGERTGLSARDQAALEHAGFRDIQVEAWPVSAPSRAVPIAFK